MQRIKKNQVVKDPMRWTDEAAASIREAIGSSEWQLMTLNCTLLDRERVLQQQ